ncbi:GTP-binding protein rho1 [Coprinopsis sp. MPI-PUGE-AT-0042]|nr:GTP-binding protein rho1 [Coprinopsis sp. MPI-PUGE-AT-0042]
MADLIGRTLVVVGDCGVGKTCLLAVFAKGKFPTRSVPATYDNYVMDMDVEGVKVELGLWDTAGDSNYGRLRPLLYPKAHVILICFSIDSQSSLENAQNLWSAEIKHHRSDVPYLLVGCKSDLRDAQSPTGKSPTRAGSLVTTEQGKAAATAMGAYKYVQCSAKTGTGVRELFQYATKLSLLPRLKQPSSPSKDCTIA